MFKRHPSASALCAFVLLLFAPFAHVANAQSAPPIDILNGQTYMKQTQDMSFMSVYTVPSTGVTNIDVLTFDTTDSAPPSGGKPTYQQTIGSASKAITYNNGYPAPPSIAFGSGRMFNVTNDQFVAFGVTDDNNGSAPAWHFYYYNPPDLSLATPRQPFVSELGTVGSSQVPATGGSNYAFLSMGNLAGDGLREAAVLSVNQGSGSNTRVSWSLRVLGRDVSKLNTEVNNPGEGPELFFTSATNSTADYPYTGAPTSIATGDFNGDGKDEIAVMMADMQTIRFYSVDSTSYAVTQLSQTVKLSSPAFRAALVAGRFVDATRVDLVVVGQADTSSNLVFPYIRSYNSLGDFNPTVMQPATAPVAVFNGTTTTLFHAQAASIINPADPLLKNSVPPVPAVFGPQQLVVEAENNLVVNRFWIGDLFVNKYGFTQKSYTGLGNFCTVGMQVGNFDNQTAAQTYNPAEEVSFLATTSACGAPISSSALITDYSIQVPSELTYAFASDSWLGNRIAVSPSATGNASGDEALALFWDAADVQGRSYRLGAPEVVTIAQQIQPQIVLGLPPMQVDFVKPPDTSMCTANTLDGGLCLTNFTFYPPEQNKSISSFYNQFNFSSGSSNNVSNSATASWGLSVKTTVGVSFSFNDLENNATGSISDTAQALYNSTVKNTTSNDSTTSTSAAAFTETDDQLWFDERDLNVYYYPILGLTDQNQNPEYVEFSVPTNIKQQLASQATNYEWYQPVHEPGNILSYPVTVGQLEANFANPLSLLTKSNPFCQPVDGSFATLNTQWSNSNGNAQTTGSASVLSNDATVSGSGGIGVSGVDNVNESFSLAVGESSSLASLNVRTSQIDSSEGVTANVPPLSNLSSWGYDIAPFIFGEEPPSGNAIWNTQPLTADQKTQGPIFFGYVADPEPYTQSGLCSAGSQYADWNLTYVSPDVSLNHPDRIHWSVAQNKAFFHYANSQNKVPAHSSPTVDPLNTPFYWMKGFFITSQTSNVTSSASSIKGPVLTELVDNQPVKLTARVYNYSLADTNSADTIHVRFYGQEIENSNVQAGTLFEIGETTVAYIPGFKSETYTVGNVPQNNYVLASTDFTPSGRTGQRLGFWVLTWIEDKNGNLVTEMPGHGMTAVPGHDITNLLDPNQVPLEIYSNNIGFYGVHQPIMVVPSQALPGVGPAAAIAASAARRSVDLTVPAKAYIDDDVFVNGLLTSQQAASDRLDVSYFDGDPSKGGIPLETQRIPHIEGNSTFTHTASFQPHTCGVHKIYAQLSAPFSPTLTSPARSINVIVDAIDITGTMLEDLRSLKLRAEDRYALHAELERAHKLFEQERVSEGMSALRRFAALAGTSAVGCNPAIKRSLLVLANQADIVNSCEKLQQ